MMKLVFQTVDVGGGALGLVNVYSATCPELRESPSDGVPDNTAVNISSKKGAYMLVKTANTPSVCLYDYSGWVMERAPDVERAIDQNQIVTL
jgi:hypothetical protein